MDEGEEEVISCEGGEILISIDIDNTIIYISHISSKYVFDNRYVTDTYFLRPQIDFPPNFFQCIVNHEIDSILYNSDKIFFLM